MSFKDILSVSWAEDDQIILSTHSIDGSFIGARSDGTLNIL